MVRRSKRITVDEELLLIVDVSVEGHVRVLLDERNVDFDLRPGDSLEVKLEVAKESTPSVPKSGTWNTSPADPTSDPSTTAAGAADAADAASPMHFLIGADGLDHDSYERPEAESPSTDRTDQTTRNDDR